MARTLIMGLILLLGLPLPLFAGQITDIRPGKKTQDEIEIIIEQDSLILPAAQDSAPEIEIPDTIATEDTSAAVNVDSTESPETLPTETLPTETLPTETLPSETLPPDPQPETEGT